MSPFKTNKHAFSLRHCLMAVTLLAVVGCGQQKADTEVSTPAVTTSTDVNVYSGRHYDSDIAIYDAFTEETGIKVNLIEAGGDALIERIAREGEASPADIFITADAGILWRGDQRSIFRSTSNEMLEMRVPTQFRHPEGKWFGLAKRARVIIYNKDMGLPEGLEDYADLADGRDKSLLL